MEQLERENIQDLIFCRLPTEYLILISDYLGHPQIFE